MMMTIIQRNTSLTIEIIQKTFPGPLIPFWRGYLYMKLFNKNVVEIIIQKLIIS